MKKIAILSSDSIVGFYEPTLYPQGHSLDQRGAAADDLTHCTQDYAELTQALKRNGFDYDLVSWSNPAIDWSVYDAVLIHSPWDYYENKNAFMDTLKTIESKTLLLNPLKTVAWNIDKKYLGDAQKAGINVIETVFVEPEQVDSIMNRIPSHFWDKGCIFKPSVSAGAMDVYLLKDKAEAQKIYIDHFKGKHNTLMIQPFMDEIKQEGEWSFVFFNDLYSHGVLKRTRGEGFGVKHSTDNQKFVPTAIMVEQAKQIFEKLEHMRHDKPLYTRLDAIRRADGQLYIMEIEQIEPFLYLHARAPDAAENLVQGITRRLQEQQHV